MSLQIKHDTNARTYIGEIEGKHAHVDYIMDRNETHYLTHTEVHKDLSGKGIASKMVEHVLQDIENRGKKVVALCPYVINYIKRNPEWKRILK